MEKIAYSSLCASNNISVVLHSISTLLHLSEGGAEVWKRNKQYLECIQDITTSERCMEFEMDVEKLVGNQLPVVYALMGNVRCLQLWIVENCSVSLSKTALVCCIAIVQNNSDDLECILDKHNACSIVISKCVQYNRYDMCKLCIDGCESLKTGDLSNLLLDAIK